MLVTVALGGGGFGGRKRMCVKEDGGAKLLVLDLLVQPVVHPTPFHTPTSGKTRKHNRLPQPELGAMVTRTWPAGVPTPHWSKAPEEPKDKMLSGIGGCSWTRTTWFGDVAVPLAP